MTIDEDNYFHLDTRYADIEGARNSGDLLILKKDFEGIGMIGLFAPEMYGIWDVSEISITRNFWLIC
jgi:hypothetical protein